MPSEADHDTLMSPDSIDPDSEEQQATPVREVGPDEDAVREPAAGEEMPAAENQEGEAERTPIEELALTLAPRYTVSPRDVVPSRDAVASPVRLVLDHADLLDAVYERFRAQLEENTGAAGVPILSPAAEWLLDNFYLVQQALRQIEEDMPPVYYQELPKLESTRLKGYPRVYALARQTLRHRNALVDMVWVAHFINAYQHHAPLTMGELWAIPTMLRTALLELLIEAAVKATEMTADVGVGPVAPVSASGRAAGTRGAAKRAAPGGGAVRLREDLSEDMIVAHCIRSLRVLANQDWEAFFEQVSGVEARLRTDPAGVYARMEFESRDQYRKVVEMLALTSVCTEAEVAATAVELAASRSGPTASPSPSPSANHVGYYLLDRGRVELEAALGCPARTSERVRRWITEHALGVYLGGIALLTLLVAGALFAYAAAAGTGALALLILALFLLLPGSVVGVNAMNAFITRILPPRILPKLEFEEGLPDELRAVVVVPAMLTVPEEIDSLVRQLERHYLSNITGGAQRNLRFALLTDFADAPEEHMPEDDAYLAHATRAIEALNRAYHEEEVAPFYLLHRCRQWNPSEGVWMGWERKRGKLAEFNRLLLGDTSTSFTTQVGDMPALAGAEGEPPTRYVITLDADTVMPLESAYRLVGALAHPLNRAVFDPKTGRVVSGYTVLQPRTEVQPTSANATRFARTFAGSAGLDLYTLAVSDVYQDLFGEGSYVGKGIYEVAAFERSIEGQVPENTLLSHDLFEGLLGRAGLVTDIILYEDFPPGYLVHALRQHRWVRGDWQLLPWLLGQGRGNRHSVLSRLGWWKLFDNLRRSLREPALVLFLVLGWLVLPGSPWVWTLTTLLISALPVLTGFVRAVARTEKLGSLTHAVSDLSIELVRWLFSLAVMLHQALLALDAIVRTLVRMYLTRRQLLQWTTAAHTLRQMEDRQLQAWRQMIWSWLPALGIALLMFVVAMGRGGLPVSAWTAAVPILLLWVFAPQIVVWFSTPERRDEKPLTSDQRNTLRRLARRTWFYFERYVGPDDHWLPPDHFQEDPRGLVAHRTSPTNIGLMLLSTLSAYDLGYIGPLALTLRLRSAFDSMEALERYRGHFLNWYETRDLGALKPRYVSTVDNGNLAAMLLVLEQGLRRIPDDPVIRTQRWEGLRDVLGVLTEILETVAARAREARDTRNGTSSAGKDPGAGGADAVGPGSLSEAVDALEQLLSSIRRQVRTGVNAPKRLPELLTELSGEMLEELHRRLGALLEAGTDILHIDTLQGLRLWSERLHYHLRNMREEVGVLAAWLLPEVTPPPLLTGADPKSELGRAWQAVRAALSVTPSLREVSAVYREVGAALEEVLANLPEPAPGSDGREPGAEDEVVAAHHWCQQLREAVDQSRQSSESLLIGIRTLADEAGRLVDDMDFGFLLDRRRKVFHLGYLVDEGQLDGNHYDLLASEARSASLLAIAKGEVPQSHWLHLSRPFTQVEGTRALLSWSGSMFEFLMPDLFTRSYEGSLLDQTNRAVVRRQIAYGREHGVPWGVSESGYYRFDAQMNYQYRAFGVPGTGRKRGLGEDLVITPYASILAVSLAPQAVMENIEALTALGMMGHYGFYEAIDYTRVRLPLGREHAIVKSYMVHHHGMILMALVNVLCENVHIDRFHADPRIRAASLLLQERIPSSVDIEDTPPEASSPQAEIEGRVALTPWEVTDATPLPSVHYLSNGDYGVLVTHRGGGYSQWRDWAITRWRADTTRDPWGSWIYVQDLDTGEVWSLTDQPRAAPGSWDRTRFYPHQVEFDHRVDDLIFRLDITVAPDEPLEIRRVVVTQQGDAPRRLRITSYAELVMAPQANDRSHPAFNRMFIESEVLQDRRSLTLLFARRLRAAHETPRHVGHTMVLAEGDVPRMSFETYRASFLGRGGTPSAPQALLAGGTLSGTTGATQDPIMALAREVTLEPHATVTFAFLTTAGESREQVRGVLDSYRNLARIEQAFDSARIQGEMELRALGLDSAGVAEIQLLLSALLYPSPALRADPEVLARNRLGQSGLWPYAISGDYPILLLRLSEPEDISLVQEALQAHAYWRQRDMKVDLVLLNERDVGYEQQLNERLRQLLHRTGSDAWLHTRGGIFILNAGQLDEDSRRLLLTAARVVLSGDAGPLGEQIAALRRHPVRLPAFSSAPGGGEDREPLQPVARPTGLRFDNGYGGFSEDGRAYLLYVGQREEGDENQGAEQDSEHATPPYNAYSLTPHPWINVIANEEFGFLVSESGGGYTWAVNSGENRLTPWRNDPVSDVPGEALYMRDEETGEVWSPTPLPAGMGVPTVVRHEPGFTTFTSHSHGLRQRMRLFAATEAPVKVIHLRLENAWQRPRRLTLTYYAAWVLGPNRETMQPFIIPEYDNETGALLARNPYNTEFTGRVAFLAANLRPHSLTTDRTEFLGPRGRLAYPEGLGRMGLSGSVQPGFDPCAALQVHVDLAPGASTEVVFLLGQGEDRKASLALIRRFQDLDAVAAEEEAVAVFWRGILDTIRIETPDEALNTLLPWTLYQALSCRIWGRSALYQSSGAFGFRDQLQDVMALLHARPDLARAHILRAARHQFDAGDVLHWWHPPSGRGVRTRISDDLLWLPYVTAEYITATGDVAILDEELPFLTGEPLKPEEEERYGQYEVTEATATLYEHCLRALSRGTTSGRRGLPLIGGGDWNDGMNRVGIGGQGESVWLGWFLHAALSRFATLCELREETERAGELRARAQSLRAALSAESWDGAWYRRAYYDDGTPLGSSRNMECQIDAIAQSWAVLSGAGEEGRIAQAMASVDERLVREEEGLLLLFTPPFDKTPHDPGYIKGYPPGVRENGGQYTHAAIWTVWAFAELGQGDRAMALFNLLNPINHSRTREEADRYRVEPYVVAADVYGAPPYVGQGGWTWYTGSSGWLYRLGIEALLGIHREAGTLRVDPVIPAAWKGFAFTYRYGAGTLRVEVENPEGVQRGVARAWLDGEPLDGEFAAGAVLPLPDDGEEHVARVEMG